MRENSLKFKDRIIRITFDIPLTLFWLFFLKYWLAFIHIVVFNVIFLKVRILLRPSWNSSSWSLVLVFIRYVPLDSGETGIRLIIFLLRKDYISRWVFWIYRFSDINRNMVIFNVLLIVMCLWNHRSLSLRRLIRLNLIVVLFILGVRL